jgi:CBS domain-containing protein
VKISDILRHKGSTVVTISPGDAVTDLISRLAEHNIGALVVVDRDAVVGIVSERDVVRKLNSDGGALLSSTVSDVMTSSVVSCAPDDSVDSIGAAMTELRVRHMPVLSGGQLAGIVTVGDVVAGRIRQLEQDRVQLEGYIIHG